MARTKASVGAKVSSGKSSKARCSAAPPPSSSSSSSSGGAEKASRGSGGGGNPVCPQPTPKWQRPITNFFIGKPPSQDSSDHEDEVVAGSSKTKKRHIIESDDEHSPEKTAKETPVNVELDETIELEPLTGEKSHKIEEYYPKNDKDCDNGENGESHDHKQESNEQNGEGTVRTGESHVENGERNEQNGDIHDENGESHKHNGESHENNGEGHEEIDAEQKRMNKGKGIGKKTNKENVSNNNNNDTSKTVERKSIKRDNIQETLENSDRSVKRVKLM